LLELLYFGLHLQFLELYLKLHKLFDKKYFMLTYFKNNKAFTLLELIVVITIFGIMLLATYIPYSYYQTKAKVKMAVKDISQNIYESRNMAIN
jgi:prepilin-type N-terminal cleavage/methylation domain-containing protein